MPDVFVAGDNVLTSLGLDTKTALEAVRNDITGIRIHQDTALYPDPISLSLVDTSLLEERFNTVLQALHPELSPSSFTRMEKMFMVSIQDALTRAGIRAGEEKTLLVLSTTKGNIDLLEESKRVMFDAERIYLWSLASVIQHFFGFRDTPLIISNACISGLIAILKAWRILQHGNFSHAVVAGGDITSEFVASGFHSFQALSPGPCRPFDVDRNGLSLGEGAGTVVLTVVPPEGREYIRILGGSVTNDANHISGPSRTGEELAMAMKQAMEQAVISPGQVDYISAHGTATPFNDEMESKAIALAGLLGSPVNSYKGFIGHTLGAAGIIESVFSFHSLLDNTLFRSAGFNQLGVPEPVNIISRTEKRELKTCLKTASGFGGCNAAILYQKQT